MAPRLEGLSVTKPKGLKDGVSSLSFFSEALTVTILDLLLLLQYLLQLLSVMVVIWFLLVQLGIDEGVERLKGGVRRVEAILVLEVENLN